MQIEVFQIIYFVYDIIQRFSQSVSWSVGDSVGCSVSDRSVV